jgi:hypothetical protein
MQFRHAPGISAPLRSCRYPSTLSIESAVLCCTFALACRRIMGSKTRKQTGNRAGRDYFCPPACPVCTIRIHPSMCVCDVTAAARDALFLTIIIEATPATNAADWQPHPSLEVTLALTGWPGKGLDALMQPLGVEGRVLRRAGEHRRRSHVEGQG